MRKKILYLGVLLFSGCREERHEHLDNAKDCAEASCWLEAVHANQLYDNTNKDNFVGFLDCDAPSSSSLALCAPVAYQVVPKRRHRHHGRAPCQESQDCEAQERIERIKVVGGALSGLFNNNNPNEPLKTIKQSNALQVSEEYAPGELLQKTSEEESGKIIGPGDQGLQFYAPSTSKQERSITTNTEGPNISALLGKNQQRIQNCYERELTNNENLHGKISLDFVFSEAGKIIRVDFITDTLGNKNVNACIKGVMKRLKLSKLEQETKFSVSFVFAKG